MMKNSLYIALITVEFIVVSIPTDTLSYQQFCEAIYLAKPYITSSPRLITITPYRNVQRDLIINKEATNLGYSSDAWIKNPELEMGNLWDKQAVIMNDSSINRGDHFINMGGLDLEPLMSHIYTYLDLSNTEIRLLNRKNYSMYLSYIQLMHKQLGDVPKLSNLYLVFRMRDENKIVTINSEPWISTYQNTGKIKGCITTFNTNYNFTQFTAALALFFKTLPNTEDFSPFYITSIVLSYPNPYYTSKATEGMEASLHVIKTFDLSNYNFNICHNDQLESSNSELNSMFIIIHQLISTSSLNYIAVDINITT